MSASRTGLGMRLGIAQINVTDVVAARRFYRDTLGFAIREPFGDDAPFELDVGDGPTVLVYHVDKMVPADYPDGTGTTLVFYTEDLDATVARWRDAGVELIRIAWSEEESGVAPCPYGRFIAFRDPFGNVHEVLEPR